MIQNTLASRTLTALPGEVLCNIPRFVAGASGSGNVHASAYAPESFIIAASPWKGAFFSNLFPRALPRQGLFHSTFFTWLQIIRVTFHFSNDVFRLNLTFESAERIL